MSSKTKTTATKEEATPALVPKLRFPEFREMRRGGKRRRLVTRSIARVYQSGMVLKP